VIGHPIGCWDDLRLPRPAGDLRFADAVESSLTDISGRYVAIIAADGLQRVYPDSAGQLGVVFNAEAGLVASSLLLPAANLADPDDELARPLDLPHRDLFYPFGLTPDRKVRRLLPNHIWT
jgi:hypothetical protein